MSAFSVLSEVDSSRARWICGSGAHPQPLIYFLLSGAAATAPVQGGVSQHEGLQAAWETSLVFPIINTGSVGAIFIVITPVSTAASGSC